MEPAGSEPCSKDPRNGLYPEPDESNPDMYTLFTFNYTIIAVPNLREFQIEN
jgi:hypothetical protein